ncbi:MAG: TetR/AcrR family transcriptional regulator [Henriciella sp.]|nr:TetR/AcrR family transcriptional regulator [Henriciella sp.]
MAKADARRSELLDQLADHVLKDGLMNASLRPLAKAVGTSDRMLLYYFEDKADLIGAILDRISERVTQLLEQSAPQKPLPMEELTPTLLQAVSSDAFWPYLRLWLQMAAFSADGDPVFKTAGERIGRGFVAWTEAQLSAPDAASRARDAAEILILIEGSVLLRSLGLEDVVEQVFPPIREHD